jgi:hypothetical protein
MLVMISKSYGYLLLLDRVGASRGISGTLGRVGRESDVTILRFLCGSPCPCRFWTALF